MDYRDTRWISDHFPGKSLELFRKHPGSFLETSGKLAGIVQETSPGLLLNSDREKWDSRLMFGRHVDMQHVLSMCSCSSVSSIVGRSWSLLTACFSLYVSFMLSMDGRMWSWRASLGCSWATLSASFDRLGPLLGPLRAVFGPLLRPLWAALGRSQSICERSWPLLVPLLPPLGDLLEVFLSPLWAVLGRSCGLSVRSQAILDRNFKKQAGMRSRKWIWTEKWPFVNGLGLWNHTGLLLWSLCAPGTSAGGPGRPWAENWPKPKLGKADLSRKVHSICWIRNTGLDFLIFS